MSIEQSPEAQVERVMERYVDAVYIADVDTLRTLFHPAAVMCGYLGDALLTGTPEPFFADLAGRPSMETEKAPYKAKVRDIHTSGLTASLRLEETGFFGTLSFVNYFHLLKVDSQWKIVSKLFQPA
jgi:Putative lumazine-binding